MEERVIEIRKDLLPDVQKLSMLINHHEQILASIRAELANLLRLGHGINVAEPGWRLDAEGGVVAYVPPQQTQEVAPTGSNGVVEGTVEGRDKSRE